MPIDYRKRSVVLNGTCTVEDAEALHTWLIDNPKATINLKDCDNCHTAIVQMILAGGFRVSSPPVAPVLRMALGFSREADATE